MEPPISMDEGLADALRPARAPEGLRRELLQVARRADRPRRIIRALAYAAALSAVAVGLGWLFRQTPEPGLDIARQAVLAHTTETRMDFLGVPPDGTSPPGSWCEKQLGYAAPLPSAFQPSQVLGGRACALKSHPVAYYQLESGSGLFVFPKPLTELEKACPCSFELPKGFTARVWNEDGHGYLLVEAGPARP